MQNNISSYELNFLNMYENKNLSANTYGIEEHLREFRDSKHFNILYNCWIIEKNEYINRLSTIGMTYQTYSLHDATHAEAILKQIAYFLGENRIRQLSPTDTWLILECAYCHDLGMVVTAKDLFHELTLMRQEDFEHFSRDMYESGNNDVRTSWSYLEPLFKYNNRKNDKEESAEKRRTIDNLNEIYKSKWYKWPVHFTRAFMILIQERCRPKHAEMSYNMIKKEADEKSYEGLIPLRFRYLIAEITALHTDERESIIKKLSYKILGFDGDYAHPRFVAELIRIGDLLDMDNNRFNKYQLAVAGNLSYNSFTHQLKHRALRDFLVTPEVIRIRAEFTMEDAKTILQRDSLEELLEYSEKQEGEYHIDNDEVNDKIVMFMLKSFKELSGWLQMLREEIDFFCKDWLRIVPENLMGNCPYFEKEILLFDGESIENDLIDLRYHITEKRASEIIEGAGLYNDTFVAFIREVLQNSMDATKRKVYLDLSRKLHDNLTNPLEFYKYIFRDIEELEIKVFCITDLSNNTISLRIRDYGVGITYNDLKRMQHIGDIPNYKISSQAKKMPAWWKPTGSFGIGMQTIFYFSKMFKLKTRTEEEKLLRKMRFHSTQIGGKIDSYIINKLEEAHDFKFGTEIEINMSLKMVRLLQESGLFDKNSDYFGDITALFKNKITKVIEDIKGSFGIPVNLILLDANSDVTAKEDLHRKIDADEYLLCCFGDYFINLAVKETENKIYKVVDRTINLSNQNKHSGFSCWSENNQILLRYHWKQKKRKECSLKLYFNEICVDDHALIEKLPISFFDMEVYLFDENAENYLEVNRDKFLYEKHRYIIDRICNTHLNCLKYLLDVKKENLDTDEFKYKQAVWKEGKDIRFDSFAKEYFEFFINKEKILRQMKGIEFFIQSNDMIYHIEQGLSDNDFPIENNKIWLIDKRYKYISEVELIKNDNIGVRYIVEDLFFCCMDLAITELVCMKEVSGAYTIIYKVNPRSGQSVFLEKKDFKSYIAMRYNELLQENQNLGRIILPGIETYKILCVSRLHDNMGTMFEKKWDSAIIIPVTIEELKGILEQTEEKEVKKMIEENFLEETNNSYISIVEYIQLFGIIREQKKEEIKKAYERLLMEIWEELR